VRGPTRLAAMPGIIRLPPLLAFLAVIAVLSGCGSDEISGEIPPENATALNSALRAVNGAVALQNCNEASAAADEFVAEVNLLPLDAGAELKAELRRAGDNLRTLVSDECPTTVEPGTTQSTTEPTTTDTTTEPTTTDTTTTDSTTTDTTTTSTDETQPPGNGNGGGPPGDGGTGGTGGGSGDESDE
jgi:hypothetical protein